MLSIWDFDTSKKQYPMLIKNISADVAVIGGGMCGILTAYHLQKEGLQTVVLEADEIGSGQTHLTTAKITEQHGLCYDALVRNAGYAKAKQYVDANRRAIRRYASLVNELQIPCHFKTSPAFLYTCEPKSAAGHAALYREKAAALALGIACSLESTPCGEPLDLSRLNISQEEQELLKPLKLTGALCFPKQAQFHPLLFLYSLAEKLTIYEHSRVTRVQDHTVYTDNGQVSCKQVVFACHYPFPLYPGSYVAKLFQERSYVVQLSGALCSQKSAGEALTEGMYYSIDNGGYSLRFANGSLLMGGQGHRTGENTHLHSYETMLRDAKTLWPTLSPVRTWSAQDCMSPDHVPYIGHFSPKEPDWYVATGFNKWGMTSSMAAALILTDLICDRPSHYAQVFAPNRHLPQSAMPVLGKHLKKSSQNLSKGIVCSPRREPHFAAQDLDLVWISSKLVPGEGKLLTSHDHTVGAYMDQDQQLHLILPKCQHMGCLLSWNPDDKTWDCPCHGSRYDVDGNLLDNPAQKNAARLK